MSDSSWNPFDYVCFRDELDPLLEAARYALDHIRKLESGAYNDPQFPMPLDVKERLEKALSAFDEEP